MPLAETPVRPRAALSLNDPHLQRRISELRRPDNYTNWFYLAREYAWPAAVVGGAIAFYYWLDAEGLSWLWAIPITFAAMIVVGACQHRLATLTHEASHYILFRNRLVNEIVSEWFCMFPLLGATHAYRVQHLGHHQYPNDPLRDPDIAQLKLSGHRYEFPMSRGRFVWECVVKQFFWPPNPIRYILARAQFVVDMGTTGPYHPRARPSRLLSVVTGIYLCLTVGMTALLTWRGQPVLLGAVCLAMLVCMLVAYALVPERYFVQYPIRSDLPPRVQSSMRATFNTLVIVALGWLTWATGKPWWLYFMVLWLIPLGTSFSFFMILRQLVQHGNASQERLTNTRIFQVAWPIGAAVFPMGMDYHLPHHMFPMVPHYNLRKLHALLMKTEAYRQEATFVEGYFFPREAPPRPPTVVDLMTRG